jgi:hypothetical protein
MRCAFCHSNPADDREGAPLCAGCWSKIEERARPEPPIMQDSMDLLLMRLALASLAGRVGALGIPDLVGARPGERPN